MRVTRKNSAPGKTPEQELFSYKPETASQQPRRTDICAHHENLSSPSLFQVTAVR